MEQYGNQQKKPNVYESIAPKERIIALANAVLDKKGTPVQGSESTKVAQWPHGNTDDKYMLHAYTTGTMQGPIDNYRLEYYSAEMPTMPFVRYQIAKDQSGNIVINMAQASIFGMAVGYGPAAERAAIYNCLNILTECADPKEARRILNDEVERRFVGLVGSYVLSDLALEGAPSTVDEIAAHVAHTEYEKFIHEIKESELDKARHRKRSILDHNVRLPQPAYYETVEEAVDNPRTKTDKNDYRPVDTQTAAQQVAQALGGVWRHAITADEQNPWRAFKRRQAEDSAQEAATVPMAIPTQGELELDLTNDPGEQPEPPEPENPAPSSNPSSEV